MERRTQSSEFRNFQAPTGETPVVPQPQAKSGEFILPSQQAESTEVFSAQHLSHEHQAQQREVPVVPPRRRGRPAAPPKSALTGEFYQGSLIRKLREEKGLTIKDTAARVGYSLYSLYDLETNRLTPSQEKLERLAKLLDVPVAELEQAPAHPKLPQKKRRVATPESATSGKLYRGSLIRKLRQEKGLMMKEAEAQLGYARGSLSMIETNRLTPSQEKLERLAKLLDVPVAELEQAPAHPRIAANNRAKGGSSTRRFSALT